MDTKKPREWQKISLRINPEVVRRMKDLSEETGIRLERLWETAATHYCDRKKLAR